MVAFLVLAPGEHTIVMSDHFEGDPTSLDITIHLHVGASRSEHKLVSKELADESSRS